MNRVEKRVKRLLKRMRPKLNISMKNEMTQNSEIGSFKLQQKPPSMTQKVAAKSIICKFADIMFNERSK